MWEAINNGFANLLGWFLLNPVGFYVAIGIYVLVLILAIWGLIRAFRR